jgi:anti-sigma factor RsiW
MNGEQHRQWREMLGAYALGQLAPQEALALEAHLDGCDTCRADAHELGSVARALSAADPAHLGTAPAPPPELADRVSARIRAAQRANRTRRVRWAVAGLSAAAVVTIVALSVASVLRPDRTEHEVFAFSALPAGVEARAFLYPPEEGTPGVEVWLEVDGLTPGASYAVWVERASTGERVKCGTFEAVDGAAHVVLPSNVARSDTGAVGVSTAEGAFVMRAPVT